MPADAKAHRTEFVWSNLRLLGKPIEASAAAFVKICHRSLCRIFESTCAARIVKGNRRAGRFDAVINLRGGGDKSITSQANTRAQHRTCELENIRVAPDCG